MVEHAGDVEEYLENDHGNGRDSKESDRSHFYAHGKKNLDGMETNSCSDIKIEIGVMNAMEAPKNRDEMEHGMLKVDDKIEGKDAKEDAHPFR